MPPVRRVLARLVRENVHSSRLRKWLGFTENSFELVRNSAATLIPSLVTPSPRNLTVAITAKCNLRCVGCRYGRDYMTGHELSTETVARLLRDAADAGISTVRLYGGRRSNFRAKERRFPNPRSGRSTRHRELCRGNRSQERPHRWTSRFRARCLAARGRKGGRASATVHRSLL